MTKRPSPFEPGISRQSKIHLNNIENDLMALKSVEERTLKKLIDGSKKLHKIILNSEDHSKSGIVVHHKNTNFMQKCVTDYITVNGKKINENGKIPISSFEIPNRCFFCETSTSPAHQCVECLEFYCPACSFVIYESFEDKRVCLSCS